jgi:hypothetical protein
MVTQGHARRLDRQIRDVEVVGREVLLTLVPEPVSS